MAQIKESLEKENAALQAKLLRIQSNLSSVQAQLAVKEKENKGDTITTNNNHVITTLIYHIII